MNQQLFYGNQPARYTGKKEYEDGRKGPRGWYYQIEVIATGELTWTRVRP
jgi:hypothetical protein